MVPKQNFTPAVHKNMHFPNTLQKTIIDGNTVLLLIRKDLWRILEVPGFT
jgi:hypothetical protein